MVERRIIVLALGLAALLGISFGASADRTPPASEGLSPIERWERLPDVEKARLRARFERYQEMSQDERRELEDRARNLRRTRKRLLAQLSDEDREGLGSLPTEQRETIVDELLEDDLKAQGKRLHAKLPEEWRERLEGASPQERRRFFTQFKERNRARISLIAIDNLGRRLELPREEIAAMKRLPAQERLGKVLALRKQLQRQSVETYGLPAGLTPERWSRMLAMEPEEFFEEVMRIQESGGWREGTADEAAAPVPLTERQRLASWELFGQLRPRPSERLELAHLSPKERRAEISNQRRQRAQAILVEYEVFPPERLAELESLSDPEFYGCVRKLARESGALEERRATR